MDNLLKYLNNNNFNEIIKNEEYNNININGNYIIHLLAIRGNEEGLEYFIDNKFDINKTNIIGSNIIHLLFENGWDELANKYYTKYPELLFNINNDFVYPITLSVSRFNVFHKCFKFMLKYDKNKIFDIFNDVSKFNNNIFTLLIIYSEDNKDDKYTKFLIDNINNIDFSKPLYNPILMYSIEKNKNILTKYFINNNKGINNKNYLDLLPINMASSKNNIEVIKLLIKKSDVNYGGVTNDYLPLSIAINNDMIDLGEFLIDYVDNYDIVDKHKNTYLHYISNKMYEYSRKNNKELEKRMFNILKKIINKSDIDFVNNYKTTPRMILENYIKSKKKKKDSDTKNLVNSINSIEDKDSDSISIDIIKNTKKFNTGLFNSDIIHNALYTIYLLNKYDNLTIPTQKYDDNKYNNDCDDMELQNIPYDKMYMIIYDIINLSTNYLYPLLPSIIIWGNKDLHYIHKDLFNIIKNIHKNNNKRFILIKISFVTGYQYTHANIVLIDLHDYSVRRFEPYGINNVNDEYILDELLKDKISKVLDKKIKYYTPSDYLNNVRFQLVSNDGSIYLKKTGDPGGYCLAWCFWYIELKINNVDLEEKDLIEKASKKIEHYYRKTENPYLYFIRDYSRKLSNEKDKIFKKIKINKMNYYDVAYKTSNLDKIFDYTVKFLN